MPAFSTIALVSSLFLAPAGAEGLSDASLLVEAQLQAAAAAVAVLEKVELPAPARAERLLPLANELARLHALRSELNAAELEEAEAQAAEDAQVQQLALRLLRAMELCAASDYAGSPELAAAVRRLALAIEGELQEYDGAGASAAQAAPAAQGASAPAGKR